MSSGGHWPGWQHFGFLRALRVAQLIATKAMTSVANTRAATTRPL